MNNAIKRYRTLCSILQGRERLDAPGFDLRATQTFFMYKIDPVLDVTIGARSLLARCSLVAYFPPSGRCAYMYYELFLCYAVLCS